jgi:hypothetical protein
MGGQGPVMVPRRSACAVSASRPPPRDSHADRDAARPPSSAAGPPPAWPRPGCRARQALTGFFAAVGPHSASAGRLRLAPGGHQGRRLVDRGFHSSVAPVGDHGFGASRRRSNRCRQVVGRPGRRRSVQAGIACQFSFTRGYRPTAPTIEYLTSAALQNRQDREDAQSDEISERPA